MCFRCKIIVFNPERDRGGRGGAQGGAKRGGGGEMEGERETEGEIETETEALELFQLVMGARLVASEGDQKRYQGRHDHGC